MLTSNGAHGTMVAWLDMSINYIVTDMLATKTEGSPISMYLKLNIQK